MVAARLLFDTDEPLEVVQKFEQYKDSLRKSTSDPMPAGISAESRRLHKALSEAKLNKSVSAGALSSIEQSLRQSEFIRKDLDLGGPGTTGGLNQYDLEAPAKQLVPRKTPLRNRIARKRGVGTAHEIKRITGFTGGQTGGVPLFHPGLGETETNTFGSLSLRRGKIIEYAGDDLMVPYRQFSVSDRVTWAAENAARGYDDLRSMSMTTALYSAMLLEERMILGDRGTASGFSGALATPAAPTVTTPAASGEQVAVTGGTGTTAYVVIRATTGWGATTASPLGNSTFTTGDVVAASWTHVPGATGYDVFVGQASATPAATALFYVGTTAANSIVVQGALPSTGRTANDAVQATAHDNGYDGILPTVLNPALSGYVNYLNGPLTSVDPFQDAFAAMWDANQADPETILLNGADRLTLSNLLTSQSSASYRITLANDPATGSNGVVGALATGVQNGVTGTVVDLEVHPFMPRGVAPILSWTLPMPNTNVDVAWSIFNTQDYQAVPWTPIEFVYDCSVFWQGTFVSTAPSWSGCIAGITA